MARDDCAHYYDETLGAIDSMAIFLERNRKLVLLNKEQCKQMVLAFIQVRQLLVARRDLKTNSKCSLLLKELYRQTIAAVAVLESCCCCRVHKFPQNTKLSDSWLEVAVIQSTMVFRVILDDLNWCSRLVARAGDPSQTTGEEPRPYRYNSLLTDMDQEAIEKDRSAFRKRLDNLGSVLQPERLLANFLRERLRAPLDSNDSEDANDCSWRRTPSDHFLDKDDCVLETRWLGVRVVRKVSPLYYEREKEIMKSLDHPNIVRFITCSKEDKAILMERVETTLEEHLKLHSNLSMLEKVDIMYQIASVMAYLHGNGVAHCDIKPANLLVNPCKVAGLKGYVHLKIADFGLSVSGLHGENLLRNSSMTSRGTTSFRAPEMNGKPMNVNFKKADVFSYGLTCWHIIFHGKVPFTDMTRDERQKAHSEGDTLPFDSIPLPLQNLFERCWSKEPEERPTFSEISMALEEYKEEWLLGEVPFDQSISGLENTARRKWKVLQSTYDAVKALAVQIRPPHVRACFAKQEEDYVYPGPDHEDPQVVPATTDVEGREPEQSIPARRKWKVLQSKYDAVKALAVHIRPPHVCACFAKQEEDYVYPGPDHEDPQEVPATTDVEGREPASSRFMS